MKYGQTQEQSANEIGFLRRLLYLGPHTCPWWIGLTFDNPLRRFFHNPSKIIGPLVSPGQTVVDIGCGLGYFSLELARLVGADGRVIALDVQKEMIDHASQRAAKEGLKDRIEFHVCSPNQLGLECRIDFALAFWVLHEVVNKNGLLEEVRSHLKPQGCLLIVEPRGHVSGKKFSESIELAKSVGYEILEGPPVRFSRSAVCKPIHASLAK